jgi:hypothetical protein
MEQFWSRVSELRFESDCQRSGLAVTGKDQAVHLALACPLGPHIARDKKHPLA